MKRSKEYDKVLPLFIEWINTKQFFWLRDMRIAFGCLNSDDKEYPLNKRIKNFLLVLRENGVIQCTEARKSERQYYRNKTITSEDAIPKKSNK